MNTEEGAVLTHKLRALREFVANLTEEITLLESYVHARIPQTAAAETAVIAPSVVEQPVVGPPVVGVRAADVPGLPALGDTPPIPGVFNYVGLELNGSKDPVTLMKGSPYAAAYLNTDGSTPYGRWRLPSRRGNIADLDRWLIYQLVKNGDASAWHLRSMSDSALHLALAWVDVEISARGETLGYTDFRGVLSDMDIPWMHFGEFGTKSSEWVLAPLM